jgi:predicted phosphodiesterase
MNIRPLLVSSSENYVKIFGHSHRGYVRRGNSCVVINGSRGGPPFFFKCSMVGLRLGFVETGGFVIYFVFLEFFFSLN